MLITLLSVATPAYAAHEMLCNSYLCALQSSGPCSNDASACQADCKDNFVSKPYAVDPLVLPYFGDSQSCRLAHSAVAHAYTALSQPSPAVHCDHGSIDGDGVCVKTTQSGSGRAERCNIFCNTYVTVTCKEDSIFGGVYNLLGAPYTGDAKWNAANTYADVDSCVAACNGYDAGYVGAASSNTYECREYHLGVANTAALDAFLELYTNQFNTSRANFTVLAQKRSDILFHCGHATAVPADGQCAGASGADQFCSVFTATCDGQTNVTSYDDCVSQFGAIDAGTAADTGGDTQGCRGYHLNVAASLQGDQRAFHCQHADPTGGGVCVAPTTTTTTSSDDTSSAVVASIGAASLFMLA